MSNDKLTVNYLYEIMVLWLATLVEAALHTGTAIKIHLTYEYHTRTIASNDLLPSSYTDSLHSDEQTRRRADTQTSRHAFFIFTSPSDGWCK
jgi:hypothetical protein